MPLQLVVRHYRGADRAALSLARALTLFPDGCPALFLGRAHFGCLCHVLGPSTQSISAARAAAAKGGAGVAAGTVAYRVRLQAHPANAAQVAQLARSTLASMQPPPVRLAGERRALWLHRRCPPSHGSVCQAPSPLSRRCQQAPGRGLQGGGHADQLILGQDGARPGGHCRHRPGGEEQPGRGAVRAG